MAQREVQCESTIAYIFKQESFIWNRRGNEIHGEHRGVIPAMASQYYNGDGEVSGKERIVLRCWSLQLTAMKLDKTALNFPLYDSGGKW